MQRVDCYKYLGLLITNNLTWSAHINSKCSHAKKILRLIYRQFYSSANQDTLRQLYVLLVSPHLEYSWQVLDPHFVKDKKMLEDVQKFGCISLLVTSGILDIMSCLICLSSNHWSNIDYT